MFRRDFSLETRHRGDACLTNKDSLSFSESYLKICLEYALTGSYRALSESHEQYAPVQGSHTLRSENLVVLRLRKLGLP